MLIIIGKGKPETESCKAAQTGLRTRAAAALASPLSPQWGYF